MHFTCERCSTKLSTRASLRSHRWKVHREEILQSRRGGSLINQPEITESLQTDSQPSETSYIPLPYNPPPTPNDPESSLPFLQPNATPIPYNIEAQPWLEEELLEMIDLEFPNCNDNELEPLTPSDESSSISVIEVERGPEKESKSKYSEDWHAAVLIKDSDHEEYTKTKEINDSFFLKAYTKHVVLFIEEILSEDPTLTEQLVVNSVWAMFGGKGSLMSADKLHSIVLISALMGMLKRGPIGDKHWMVRKRALMSGLWLRSRAGAGDSTFEQFYDAYLKEPDCGWLSSEDVKPMIWTLCHLLEKKRPAEDKEETSDIVNKRTKLN